MNAEQIYLSIKAKYKKYVSMINKILQNIRHLIADYLKQKYREIQIIESPETYKILALDESLFIHNSDNTQVWNIEPKKLILIENF